MAKQVGEDDVTDVRSILGMTKGKLKGLLNRLRGHNGQVSEIREQIRDLMSNAVDKDHAHPGVVKLILKLDGMDAIKRNEYLYHFDVCRGHMGWDTSDLLREETPTARRLREDEEGERAGA